jgi:hypothetical protein
LKKICFDSFDLGKKSYQKVLLPDHRKEDVTILYLSVPRDCLCSTYGHDIWIMKIYENKESWTKLFSVSYIWDPSYKWYYLTKAFYMFEDRQVLLILQSSGEWSLKLIVYDPRIGTFKFQDKSIYDTISPCTKFCIESLISHCS